MLNQDEKSNKTIGINLWFYHKLVKTFFLVLEIKLNFVVIIDILTKYGKYFKFIYTYIYV